MRSPAPPGSRGGGFPSVAGRRGRVSVPASACPALKTTPSTPPPAPLPRIGQIIAAAFRQNRRAGLLLNLFVAGLVASYYWVPSISGIWQAIGEFKTRWAVPFAFFSTAFVAAVLPFLIESLQGKPQRPGKHRRLMWLILFWGYRGIEIDLFYRLQGMLFGHGNDFRTLAVKVAVDQFVYTPFWALPTYVIALRLVDYGGFTPQMKASLDRAFLTRTLPAILFTNWMIWIPAVTLVYSLPAALQFPLFSVIMCFFILVVTLMARGGAELGEAVSGPDQKGSAGDPDAAAPSSMP